MGTNAYRFWIESENLGQIHLHFQRKNIIISKICSSVSFRYFNTIEMPNEDKEFIKSKKSL